jgi:hypothetical protein
MNEVILRQAPKTGYAYAVRLPYRNLLFVKAFKELVPEPSRDWHPGMACWLFRSNYLEPVRQLVDQFANQEGWRVVDCVAMPKDEAQRLLEALDIQLYEEHVNAVLHVLAGIPHTALTLAGWFHDRIVLDLYERIEDADLFRELMRLERPHSVTPGSFSPYIPGRSSRDPRVIVANDDRVIRALCRCRTRNLQPVAAPTPLQPFEDGVVHFQYTLGDIWFGAPHSLALAKGEELYEPGDAYQIVLVDDDQVYLVARADDHLPQVLRRAVSPGVIVSSKFQPRFPLFAFLQKYHLFGWFKAWSGRVLASEQLQAGRSPEHRYLWESAHYWIHPVDSLVAYLQATHSEDIQELLRWDEDYLQRQQQRIQQLKEQQRHAYLLYCQEHAIELARPLLERKMRDDLFALGERHAISVRPSWPIARRVQALLSHGQQSQQLAWDVLGLTPARSGG